MLGSGSRTLATERISDDEILWLEGGCAIFLFVAVTAIASFAQTSPKRTFTTLFTFNTTDGISPYAPLIQGPDGNFYGTTQSGGTNCPQYTFPGCGTVFKITPAGKLTSLYSFCAKTSCPDGAYPDAGMLLANNGNLYGTTASGGNVVNPDCFNQGCGTIFEITPAGKLITLYTFCSQTNCADGAFPYAGLMQGTDGSFYGTTSSGGVGSNCIFAGVCGTIFRITPAGELTTLYNFCSQTNCTDGSNPAAGLIQAADGDFYGTTQLGGVNCATSSGCGTIFKISPAGKLTTLYSFCSQGGCGDGISPQATLIQAADGDFYGSTSDGGLYDCEGDDELVGCGTIFKISAAGAFTVLQRFYGANGYTPSGLIQATDLNFYGTTLLGGTSSLCGYPFDTGCGTVFKITPDYELSTLHDFCVQTSYNDGT